MASLVVVQIGYNWEALPNWSLASKRIGKGASQKASQSHSDPYITLGSPRSARPMEAKISWFGTARGRVGYAWDRLLFYGTGGLAYGGLKSAGTMTDAGIFLGTPFSATTPYGVSSVKAGWTAGAGVEGEIISNWTWKAEYLYADLGSINVSAPGGTAFLPADAVAVHARFTDNILRVGVNLRFH